MYGLQCLDSWLYDGDPMTHLCYQETFDFLKKKWRTVILNSSSGIICWPIRLRL